MILTAPAVRWGQVGRERRLLREEEDLADGEEDDRVVRIAGSIGLRTIQFDLASGDPDSSISKERLIEYVSSMAKSGSIIVMHINRHGWHTAQALPEIISRLRKRGFTFVTVGELLSQLQPSNITK